MNAARRHAIRFLGTSLDDLRAFPPAARQRAGYQLQAGRDPDDWKPMQGIGPGVREIRIRDTDGAFRVVYVAKLAEAIVVLHCFRKTTGRTAQHDLDLAAQRYRALLKEHRI